MIQGVCRKRNLERAESKEHPSLELGLWGGNSRLVRLRVSDRKFHTDAISQCDEAAKLFSRTVAGRLHRILERLQEMEIQL